MGKTTAALYFGLIALGLLMAALTNGALAWDGSYLFFVALDEQEPYIPHAQRFILLVGQGATLLGSQWTDDVALLRFLFGFAFALLSSTFLLGDRQGPGALAVSRSTLGSDRYAARQIDLQRGHHRHAAFRPLLLALVGAERRWLPAIVVPGGRGPPSAIR